MGRDFNIYGIDETAMAESIASGALGSPSSNAHSGNPIDQSAKSKGTSGQEKYSESGDAAVHSDQPDSRAKTAGNHGKQD